MLKQQNKFGFDNQDVDIEINNRINEIASIIRTIQSFPMKCIQKFYLYGS